MNSSGIKRNKTGYELVKRLLDVIISIFILVLLFPLWIIISVIIMIDDSSAGPLFSQERVGLNESRFILYKFRTMCSDAEDKKGELQIFNESDGPTFKIKDDPRITRIGKWLRMSSVDEFPQFFNVLKGEMSVVGPRPALPEEVEKYTDYQKQRLSVKPGITCYWQIQENRNDISFDEWVELDLKYIKDMGIKTDAIIFFKTIGAVFGMNGV